MSAISRRYENGGPSRVIGVREKMSDPPYYCAVRTAFLQKHGMARAQVKVRFYFYCVLALARTAGDLVCDNKYHAALSLNGRILIPAGSDRGICGQFDKL